VGSDDYLDGVVPGALDGGELSGGDNDEGPGGGEDVHDSVDVGGVHVLGLVSLEAALGVQNQDTST
jgi:hypothetical protein